MARRSSSSGRSNQSRSTARGGSRTGGGGRSKVAGRKSPAGGRGNSRTAGGRTRTVARGTSARSRRSGGSRSTTTTTTTTTTRTREARRGRTGRSRAAGQMSEQEKRRLAARSGGGVRARQSERRRSGSQNQNRSAQQGRESQGMRNREYFNGEETLYQRTSDYRQQKRMEEDVFAPTIQKANLWLREVMTEIGTEDRHRAQTALKSVLQTLRDRLTVEEAVDLASQLPTLIRGIYFEGWKPAGKPIKYSKEEFITAVSGYFQNLSGINHTEIIRAVFNVLQRNIADGEIRHLIGTMPEEFADFWIEQEPVNP